MSCYFFVCRIRRAISGAYGNKCEGDSLIAQMMETESSTETPVSFYRNVERNILADSLLYDILI
jgi:hypothetical protein